ncbi:MAG: anhydro-N-acetylmuramic acid kinase [Candidatus Solibacter usitatus]|nr:anhydro-N-acetylmuramic acid kinase [Candidatus Solibacter usitatus]
MRVAGIMSGTSLDGIDVAVVELPAIRTLKFLSVPYPAKIRERLMAVSNAVTHTAEISRLNYEIAELYAKAVKRAGKVDLIGCHGQTIYHEGRRNTLQIGEAAVLAERTGTPVVSNFRARDIAAGGQGAPLVPFVDYKLFRHRSRTRVALNIGGIANITVIPAGARPEDVVAFDTGPGNMAIDALTREYSGGKLSFDRGGKIAASGKLDRALLDDLLADAYYRKRAPKSAGREQYGAEFVARLKQSGGALCDLITTATVLTAATIAKAVTSFVKGPLDLIVSGGGAHNPEIVGHLAAFLPQARVAQSSDFGVDVDAKEAIAFAILAYETWRGRPSNLPSATGARRAVLLGSVTPTRISSQL